MQEVKINKRSFNLPIFDAIAAGDLANHIGGYFMEDLQKAIDNHRKYEKPILYFVCQIRKDPTDTTKINLTIAAMDKRIKYLRESTDLWQYDYKNEKLELLWSIPHRTEMKNFLRNPDKYSKDLIKWIKKYLKQEKINLNDSSSQVITS